MIRQIIYSHRLFISMTLNFYHPQLGECENSNSNIRISLLFIIYFSKLICFLFFVFVCQIKCVEIRSRVLNWFIIEKCDTWWWFLSYDDDVEDERNWNWVPFFMDFFFVLFIKIRITIHRLFVDTLVQLKLVIEN